MPDPTDALAAIFAEYRAEPKRFAREFLGFEPWAKQIEVLEAIRDYPRVAVPSCHGVGKSAISGVASWWWKLCHEPSKVIITAPGGRQASMVLGGEIRARYSDMRRRYSLAELEVMRLTTEPTSEGWRRDEENFILWFATRADDAREHSTRATGWHSPHLLLIFEEAGGVAKPIWDAIQGNLAGAHRHFLAIGNPSDPTGPFARMCRDSATRVVRIDALDFPNVVEGRDVLPYGPTRAWVEEMRRIWGDGSGAFQWKVRGQFPTVAMDTLMGYDEVRSALERVPIQCVHGPARVGLGVDVARFGDDATTLYAICGACGVLLDFKERRGSDTMATAGLAIQTAREVGLHEQISKHVAIDDTGVGGGVVDRMRELGWRNVRAENFGAGPQRESNELKFLNRRTELWWGLREWVRSTAALASAPSLVKDRLLDDLTAPKYTQKSDQRIALEPKADIKKRIGRSPDHGDGLCLAVAASSAPIENVSSVFGRALRQMYAPQQQRIGDPDRLPGMPKLRPTAKQSYIDHFSS